MIRAKSAKAEGTRRQERKRTKPVDGTRSGIERQRPLNPKLLPEAIRPLLKKKRGKGGRQ